jgi:hypothetical protein
MPFPDAGPEIGDATVSDASCVDALLAVVGRR